LKKNWLEMMFSPRTFFLAACQLGPVAAILSEKITSQFQGLAGGF
jgi:hypothetical protein